MKDTNDDQLTVSIYTDLLAKHGVSFRALDWGSQESQEKRFQIISEIGFANSDSVLDVGCGLGDLYLWLNENGLSMEYYGLDITEAMVIRARERFPKVHFKQGSLVGEVVDQKQTDYVVASGIFFLRKDDPVEYMQRCIVKMYELARKGVAFNSLSSWYKADDKEFRADPSAVLEFCKSLTRRVVLRHDYHDGDFTVYLYKH